MKTFFFFTVLLFAMGCHPTTAQNASPQSAPATAEQQPIQFYGRSFLLFQSFWQQQQQLLEQEEGQLRIFHFGDSHIQAGWFPHRMRQHFQQLHKDFSLGHRGLVFPYPVAKTNNPANYQIDYHGQWASQRSSLSTGESDFGLCGITVCSNDPQATVIFRQDDSSYATSPFTRIRVFHTLSPSAPRLRLDDEENILFRLADENYGFTLFLLKKPVSSFRLSLDVDSSSSDFCLYGISLENTDAGTSYSALGVNGASTQSMLRLNLLEQELFCLSPHLLIFSLGTNDVYAHFKAEDFANHYAQLLERVRRVLPDIPILLTTPGDALRDKQWEIAEMPDLILAMRELAQTYDCALWDFYAAMGGKGGMQRWSAQGLAHPDKLHLLRKGYERQGDLLFEALQEAYHQSLKKTSR